MNRLRQIRSNLRSSFWFMPSMIVICIDYLTAIMARIAQRQIPRSRRYAEGELRVIAKGPCFKSLLAESFDQIRSNAKDDVAIMSRMLGALAVLEHHSRPSGLPLILAALPQHHDLFRRISQNPFLIAEGLTINPDVLPINELREHAWKVVEPQYPSRLAELSEQYEQAQSDGLGNNDLAQVAQAATAGRVATLLIEADRQIAGRIDDVTGQVEVADQGNPQGDPQGDDLLDDLVELVEKTGGQVLVIPAEQMPGRTGLAATYRY